MRKKKGFYSISVVAKMFSVHQQTIRMYEKQGLITPKRSSGNTRLFSEDDVDRLEEVIYLTHKLGVNLAGVEIILKLQKKVKRMQDEMNKLFNDTESELELETQHIKEDIKKQAERLGSIKKETTKRASGYLIDAQPVTAQLHDNKTLIKKRVQELENDTKAVSKMKLADRSKKRVDDDFDESDDIQIEYEK